MNEIRPRRSAKVKSPCVQLCMMHPETNLCTGCNRTIEEITGWRNMDEAERTRIMAELPHRGAALSKRRGGRAARLKKPPLGSGGA